MSSKAQRSLTYLIGFVVVAAGLGFWAYQNAKREVITGQAPGEVALLPFAPPGVTTLTIKAGNVETVVSRTPYGWMLTKPHPARADYSEVGRLLKNLSNLRAKILFSDDQPAPADDLMGVDAPRVVFDIRGPKDANWGKLLVGKSSEFDRSLYARATDAQGVTRDFTISSGRESQFTGQDWERLRDKRVLAARKERIQKITVIPDEPRADRVRFTLEVDPTSPPGGSSLRYLVTEPDLGAAAEKTAETVFTSLSRAPLLKVVDKAGAANLAAYGLDKPAFTVTIDVKPLPGAPREDLQTRTILLHPKPDSEYIYVARTDEPWVAEALAVTLSGLSQNAETLRSARITGLDRDKVTRLEIDTKESGHIVLEKKQVPGNNVPQWQMLAPEPAKVRQHLAVGLLLTFSDIVGSKRVAEGAKVKDKKVLARTGLDDPMTVRLFTGKSNLTTVLIGYGKKDDEAYAMLEGGNMIVAVGKSRINELPLSSTQLIDPS